MAIRRLRARLKELIDNALDANAASIAVEISANALDVVQVKDNGHGIAAGDRDAMAVRYSTSKISDLRELENIGGRSLGFRGVALSAACQMAGEMVITTRVEGESVAEACWIDKKGNVEARERASHPNSAKILAKIQQTMRACALARPNVRFSLRVGKGGKGNWLYTPRRKATPQLDLSLIIGKDAAGQCICCSYPPPVRSDGEGARSVCRDTYSIEAFIPRPDAATSDPPPRGTLLASSSIHSCMNIICPVGSYDVNVEPAKDDVQFGDPGAVLSVIEKFLQSVYGELKPQALGGRTSGPGGKGRNEFDILLARKCHQVEQNQGTIIRSRCGETANDGLSDMLVGSLNNSAVTMDRAAGLLLSPLSNPISNNIRATGADHPEAGPETPPDIGCSDLLCLVIAQSAWKFTMYGYGDEDDEEMPLEGGVGGVELTGIQDMGADPGITAISPPHRPAKARPVALPLDRIPAVFRVHNLSTTVATTIVSVEKIERAIAPSDAYVASGKASYAFPSDLGEVCEIEAGLRKLTRGMCQDETGKTTDLNVDLNMLMGNDINA
ncbi:MAG: hypothetical protein M1839_001570 [Geoglossum umbratile]|nr:MAG: hypothetical protein M1839_001570 [Geoglossum umbratile]